MMEPRETRFWQAASQLKLVHPKELQACWDSIPPEKRTRDAVDRRLARQVVAAGHMTLWQAQRILAGRQEGLFIDRYILLDQIGQGGMGRVYLAKDTRLGRQVAIKILSRERMQNPRALTRFHREAKVGAMLQQENLIRVYDEGALGGMPYLVMEYIEGQNVAHLIAEQGRLEPENAAELARQVALGLEHLHQKSLLHRDVNPANILVDRDGTAKLTDLGLAIDMNDEEDVVTRDGATVGTFDYISPEQARSPRKIDTRSDIYSLGCTLYHMIAGHVPYPATSLPEKLIAHQGAAAERLTDLVPGVSEGLAAIVEKMMSKDPADRYQRPADVARALTPFSRGARLLGRPVQPTKSTATGTSIWDSTPVSGGASKSEVKGDGARGVSRPAKESSSDPFDLFQIDLGPAISLTGDGTTPSRSRSGENSPVPAKWLANVPKWWWIAAAAGVVAVVGLLAFPIGGEPTPKPVVQGKPAPPAPAKRIFTDTPISVDFGDEVVASASLEDAIRLATGKRGSLVLSNAEPLELTVSATIPVNSNLTIRAANGAAPEIRLRFEAPVPFLTVDSRSPLKLEGLHFRVEVAEGVAAPPGVLAVGGTLEMKNCSMVVAEGGPAVSALAFSGQGADISECWLEGFRPAIRAQLFPGSRLLLTHSQLIGGPVDSAGSGWALELQTETAPRSAKQEREVALERVTVVGVGLARMLDSGKGNPLRFTVHDTVICGRALLQWADTTAVFPGEMVWSGQSNLYDLRGPGWVVADDEAGQAIAGAPAQLDTWSQGAVLERETRAEPARFVVEPPGTGRSPLDYSLREYVGTAPGADVKQVAAPPGRSL